MNARTPRLFALLLMGLASGPLFAHGWQNQPAQPPQPPTDEEVQKFLDAPVWYLSWRMSVVCRGSGANWTASLQHVRHGAAELGIRSQGPTLFRRDMNAEQLERQAFFDMIPKYTNWVAGPLITDDMTPQQQEEAFPRVMEQNQKAFARHQFSSESSEEGNLSRTRMQGAGPIIDFADYQFEIDAVNKKYLFKPSSGYTDGQPNGPVLGETVTHIGTIHEVRLPIEYGLEGGGTTMQLTAAEPLGLSSGPLPASFGSISGSPSWAVVVNAHGKEMRGTLMIQFSLSPKPPEPAELIIIPPDKLPDWRPTAAEDEKTRGDFVPVKVKLQKVGGGDPQFKAQRFVYRLKSSKERGVCMNWPPTPEADSPFDFQFEQELNTDYDIIGMDRQIAEQFGDKMTEGEVNVSCFDYGAYGELEVLAELENGQVVYGVVQGTQSERVLKLPLRADDSLIANAFVKNLPNPKDDDDSENDPVGDGFLGDGLSLYEEYRGFKVGDSWTYGDPKKKDVFVLNQMRGMPQVIAGIKLFERATGLKVHYELKDNQVNAVMNINFWATTGPHVVDQHVIRIQAGEKLAASGTAFVEGGPGTPGTAKSVHMPPDWAEFRNVAGVRAPDFERALAHEMVHACNVYHHGESDEMVEWTYVSNAANPVPHIVESGVNGTQVIVVQHENGSPYDISMLFPDPARTPTRYMWIGNGHGQHSGDDGCLMRYDIADAFRSQVDHAVRYIADDVIRGTTLCDTTAGTGVNDAARQPQSHYGSAATAANGGPGVLADRGDCKHQIRVNDKGQEPER